MPRARSGFLEPPLLPPQPLRTHRPQRRAHLAKHLEGILRGTDESLFDRPGQGVVEEPLGLGTRRLPLGPALERIVPAPRVVDPCLETDWTAGYSPRSVPYLAEPSSAPRGPAPHT